MFELVVAIAVSALVMVAIVSMVTNAIRSATYSRNKGIAEGLSKDVLEWLRVQRDTDTMIFISKAAMDAPGITKFCFQNLDWSLHQATCNSTQMIDNLFFREGSFETLVLAGVTLYRANITVRWTDSQGDHSITNTEDFADWRQR